MRAGFDVGLRQYDASSISGFLRCEKMFYWRDIRGFDTPKSPALDMGSAIHAGIAAWLKGESFEQAIQDELEHKELFGETLSLMKGYVGKFAGDEWFKDIVSIEQEFNLPLLMNGGISVTGRMDVVVRKGEGIYLVEHKTTSKIDSHFFSKFRRDLQTLFYSYAVRRLYGRIDGMLIDVLVKRQKDPYPRAEIQIFDSEASLSKFESDVCAYSERVQSAIQTNNFIESLPQCYVYGECAYLPLCLRGEHPAILDRYVKRGEK